MDTKTKCRYCNGPLPPGRKVYCTRICCDAWWDWKKRGAGAPRPCKECGKRRPPRNGAYCSVACRKKGRVKTNACLRSCIDCGEACTHKARRCVACAGLQRRRPRPPRPCKWCGAERPTRRGAYCSDRCRDESNRYGFGVGHIDD
jgi:hypothetical protein